MGRIIIFNPRVKFSEILIKSARKCNIWPSLSVLYFLIVKFIRHLLTWFDKIAFKAMIFTEFQSDLPLNKHDNFLLVIRSVFSQEATSGNQSGTWNYFKELNQHFHQGTFLHYHKPELEYLGFVLNIGKMSMGCLANCEGQDNKNVS